MLDNRLKHTFEAIDSAVSKFSFELIEEKVGIVNSVGDGIAMISGLRDARADEILLFPQNVRGLVFNLDRDEIGCILLDTTEKVHAGDKVRSAGDVLKVPVGKGVVGRVITPMGDPLDGKGPIPVERYEPIEREAARIVDRQEVTQPLETGIKSIDVMIPIGRGQRELILGDRRVGKTAIAIDTILNQKNKGVFCFYVGIGQKSSSTAQLIDTLKERDALEYTTVVVAGADTPPGLQYIAPYAACSMAEYFMESGEHALIIYDDLTKHANVYRELSLLLRRPPGREAYPGDIFYIHSRLLERAARLNNQKGGGTLTALPIIETQAQNISAYIPTNLISITDGQIYLDPILFNQGHKPAVDIGKSVSRVGGKTQIPAMKELGGRLKLDYSQFLELEIFTQFGAKVEDSTQKAIEKGRRIKEVLKQPRYEPLSLAEQVLIMFAASRNLLAELGLKQIHTFELEIRKNAQTRIPEILNKIESGSPLTDEDKGMMEKIVLEGVENFKKLTHSPSDK
ncbi:MAG: F0F1 ATP synthase subunit alpha [Pseudomonadota bacterium]